MPWATATSGLLAATLTPGRDMARQADRRRDRLELLAETARNQVLDAGLVLFAPDRPEAGVARRGERGIKLLALGGRDAARRAGDPTFVVEAPDVNTGLVARVVPVQERKLVVQVGELRDGGRNWLRA